MHGYGSQQYRRDSDVAMVHGYNVDMVILVAVVEKPGQVWVGGVVPPPGPAGFFLESIAASPGEVPVLPPWEHVPMPGPGNR